MELLGAIDELLSTRAFMGFESRRDVATCIIAAEAHHPMIREMINEYQGITFLLDDGSYDYTTNVKRLTNLLCKKGLVPDNRKQLVEGMDIYPQDYFSPKNLNTGKIKITANTRAIHHFSASWMSSRQRFNTKVAQLIGPTWTKRIKRMLHNG